MTNQKTKYLPLKDLQDFCHSAFTTIGADRPTTITATKAIMHGSIHGIDSHGVRLLAHYVKALEEGRLNKSPELSINKVRTSTSLIDADNAHGARATFAAIDLALKTAKTTGISAVGIQNTSHFGPAGAYSTYAAISGFIAIVFGNSDSFVKLHNGKERFHGTNPISIAVPSHVKEQPWLLDMATSSVPFNRIELYRSLNKELPKNVATDELGQPTTNPHIATILSPLGGEFGFKGAALGGVSEIFSSILTGMLLSPEILPMMGPDFKTPRKMGAFVIVIDPNGFLGLEAVKLGMESYLSLLRKNKSLENKKILAPGDREWQEAQVRKLNGIPIDPETFDSYQLLAEKLNIKLPF